MCLSYEFNLARNSLVLLSFLYTNVWFALYLDFSLLLWTYILATWSPHIRSMFFAGKKQLRIIYARVIPIFVNGRKFYFRCSSNFISFQSFHFKKVIPNIVISRMYYIRYIHVYAVQFLNDTLWFLQSLFGSVIPLQSNEWLM